MGALADKLNAGNSTTSNNVANTLAGKLKQGNNNQVTSDSIINNMMDKKLVPGASTAVLAAKPAPETGLGIGDLAKTIPNAFGDIWGLIKQSTDTVKNVAAIPGTAASLVKEQGLGNAIKNTVSSIPGAVASTAYDLIPQSLKEIGNTNALAEIPSQFKSLVNQNGGSYANALLKTIEAAPGAIPDAVLNYANQIDRARQSVENHPVNEFLGYLGLKTLENSGVKDIPESTKPADAQRPQSGFLSPFVKSYSPEMANMFESEGIKAPVSAINRSPFLQALEATSSKTAFGGKIRDIAVEAQSALEQKVSDLVEKVKPQKSLSDEAIGNMLQKGAEDFHKNLASEVEKIKPNQNLSAEDLGKKVQQGLKEYEDNFKLSEGKIYNEFSKTYGSSNVYGKSTKNAIATLLDEQKQSILPPDAIDSKLKYALNKITGSDNPELKTLNSTLEEAQKMNAKPSDIASIQKQITIKQAELDKNLTFNELKKSRTDVGELLQKNPENTVLKRLYGALSEDMKTAVKQVGESDPFGDAQSAQKSLEILNQGYQTGKATIENNIAQSISKSSPDTIVQNLVKKNSAGTLAQLKEMIGADRFGEVQKSFLKKVINDSEKDGVYNPQKIKDSLAEYDQETINKLLSPEQQKNLNSTITGLEKNNIKSEIASSIKNDTPEKIAQNIAKRNSAEYLKNVKDIVGEDKFTEISKQFLQQQFEKSVTRNKFDINKFKTNLGGFDQATLEQIIPKEDLKILKEEVIPKFEKFNNLNEVLKSSQKMRTGSETAFLRDTITKKERIFTALGAAATGHFGIAATIGLDIGGELALSKLFTSDFGRKLLTEGLTKPNLKILSDFKGLSDIKKQLIIQSMRLDQKNNSDLLKKNPLIENNTEVSTFSSDIKEKVKQNFPFSDKALKIIDSLPIEKGGVDTPEAGGGFDTKTGVIHLNGENILNSSAEVFNALYAKENINATEFNKAWEKAAKNDPDQIIAHVENQHKNYQMYKNMDNEKLAHDRFGLLSSISAQGGLKGIPQPLQIFYKNILK